MFKILEGLLKNNDGVLKSRTKRQIIAGIKKSDSKITLSYPPILLKYGINYNLFPEVWEMIISTLFNYKDEINVVQFYYLIG